MVSVFNDAVLHAETRLKGIVQNRLFHIAEGAAKHYSLKVNPEADVNWVELIKEAETNSDKFEILKLYYSRTRRMGLEPEPIVSTWICDYLDGIIKEPTRRQGAPKKWGGRDFLIWNLIEVIAQKFSLTISRNEASLRESACDAVSMAVINVNKTLKSTELIRPTSYNELRQLHAREKKKFISELQSVSKL